MNVSLILLVFIFCCYLMIFRVLKRRKSTNRSSHFFAYTNFRNFCLLSFPNSFSCLLALILTIGVNGHCLRAHSGNATILLHSSFSSSPARTLLGSSFISLLLCTFRTRIPVCIGNSELHVDFELLSSL